MVPQWRHAAGFLPACLPIYALACTLIHADANYRGIQEVYERYREYNFEVLAFPCNQVPACLPAPTCLPASLLGCLPALRHPSMAAEVLQLLPPLRA
jgi:hypothetical protein